MKKICEYCGKPFDAKVAWAKYCSRPHYITCPVCGSVRLSTYNEQLSNKYFACSYACRKALANETNKNRYGNPNFVATDEFKKKSEKTMQMKYNSKSYLSSDDWLAKRDSCIEEKFGVRNVQMNPEIRKKTEETCLKRYGSKTYLTSEEGLSNIKSIMVDKYGVEHPSQSDEIMNKIKESVKAKYGKECYLATSECRNIMKEDSKNRYGVKWYTQSDEIKKKTKETCIQKYMVDNPSKCDRIKDKIRRTMLDRYGEIGVMNIPEIHDRIVSTNMTKYGVPYYIMVEGVANHGTKVSKLNKDIFSELSQKVSNCTVEKLVGRYSFDIAVDDILLDINPTYTHNLIGNHWNPDGLSYYYHRDKLIAAIRSNYKCRLLFDWNNRCKILDDISKYANESSSNVVDCSDTQLVKLSKSAYFEFSSRYSLSSSIRYARSLNIGVVQNRTIIANFHCEYVNQLNKVCITDISSRFGYKLINYEFALKLICNLLGQSIVPAYIDLCKIPFWLDVDISNAKFFGTSIIWSKKADAIVDSNFIDASGMYRKGWLPVADAGKLFYEFNLS